MKRIELQLTNFEQAKALKELGFPQNIYTYKVYLEKTIPHDINAKECDLSDWQCIGGKLIPCSSDYSKYGIDTCSCPTLELVAKWLRDEKDIHISCEFEPLCDSYGWVIGYEYNVKVVKLMLDKQETETTWLEHYKTYEEALSAGIDKVIEFLSNKI